MENFENKINLDTTGEDLDVEKNFKDLIEKLESKKTIFIEVLKSFSEEEKLNFDIFVLNPNELTWTVFNGIDKDEDKILELINKFRNASDSKNRKEIGKQIADLIE